MDEPREVRDLEPFQGEPLEVRRNAGLLWLVALGGLVLGVAYGWRGLDGSLLALLVALLLVGVGGFFALAAFDARSPVMVVDLLGFRYRDGRTWTGVPWEDVGSVTLRRHRRPWQDGSIDVVLVDGERVATRVGLSTPVAQDVVARLRALAQGRSVVAEVVPSQAVSPETTPEPAPEPAVAETPARDEVYDQERDASPEPPTAPVHDRVDATDPHPDPDRDRSPAADEQPVAEEPAPRPAARIVAQAAIATRAIRANLSRPAPPVHGTAALQPEARSGALPEARHLDPRTDRPGLVLEPVPLPVEPEPIAGPPPVVWEPELPEVAIVGEQVAAARRRLGISVESLAERTRIRPHVIEAIEVDDFGPCGGDFYARGHLRSIARILGMDADALVADHDEHYAQAPVGARRVFEAELATGPSRSIRLTTGGPNWGALLGVVMVVAIVWGIGHLLTDRGDAPAEVSAPPAPSAAASEPAVDPGSVAGLGAPTSNRLVLRGRGEPTRVVVRDGEGETVWSGRLADGDSATVRLVGRGSIVVADGGAVAVRVNDRSLGRLGDPGERVEQEIGKR